MNILFKVALYVISIPARLKGMKFGKNSYIGPGYDCVGYVKFGGVTLGDNIAVGKRAWFDVSDGGKIDIGDNVNIGRDAVIVSKSSVKIGEGSLFSYRVSVIDHEHDFSIKPLGHHTKGAEPVIIGKNCFIGAGAFILKGVELGDNCIVGANAVVTKSFPQNSLIGGAPAKLLKEKG